MPKENNNKNRKRKKSASEFFSRLNTQKKESKNEEVLKNPKSKSVKWILGGLVVTATTLGIAIPWALSSCSIYAKTPISDNEIMYEITIGGKTYFISFNRFKKRINSFVTSDNNELNNLENSFNYSVLKKIYNNEHNGYLKMKAIIDQYYKDNDKSTVIGATTLGNDVSKNFNEIRNAQTKSLNSAKKNFQKNSGSDWLNLWSKELATNSIYGIQNLENATTKSLSYLESKAIDYMTTTAIKEGALARYYSAEINTSQWNADILDWNPSKQIKFKQWNNDLEKYDEIVLNPNDVTQYIKSFLILDKNVVKIPLDFSNSNDSDNKQKLAVFQTKSYIPEFRVPNETLINVLPKYYNSAVISSFHLEIKPGETNFGPFSFDGNLINNLFKITTNPKNSFIPSNSFTAISRLWNFQGATTLSNNQRPSNESIAKDNQLISNLTDSNDSNESKIAGSSKYNIFDEFLKQSSNNNSSNNENSKSLTREGENNSSSSNSSNVNSIALISNGIDFTNDSQKINDFQLLQAKEYNPILTFIKLLWSIDFNSKKPSILNDLKLESYYNAIYLGEATDNVLKLIELLKSNFDLKDVNNQITLDVNKAVNIDLKQTTIGNTISDNYNNSLKNLTNALVDDDKKYLGKLMTISFVDPDVKTNYTIENNDINLTSGYWSIYKLSSNTYLYVTSEGLKIFTREIISSINAKNKINSMILSDVQRTANSTESNKLPVLYDVSNIFTNLKNEAIINETLLNQDNNEMLFKYQLYVEKINSLKEEEKINSNFVIQKYDDNGNFLKNDSYFSANKELVKELEENVQKFKTYTSSNIVSLIASNKLNGIKSITNIIIDILLKSEKYYDFAKVIKDNNLKEEYAYWQSPQRKWTNNPLPNDEELKKYLGKENILNTIYEISQNIITPINNRNSNLLTFNKKVGK